MRLLSKKNELLVAVRERVAPFVLQSPNQVLAITPEQEWALALLDASEWVDQIGRSEAPLFKLKSDKGVQYIHHAPLGLRLWRVWSACIWTLRRNSSGRRYHPNIELLLDALKGRGLHLDGNFQAVMQANPALAVDTLSGIVEETRQRSKARAFMLAVQRFEDGIERRFRDTRGYLARLEKAFPSSLMIRLELYYAGELKPTGGDLLAQRYDRLCEHSAKWLAQAGESLGPALVGDVWKFDFDDTGLVLMHVVLILNGPQISELNHITSMLQDNWTRIVTNAERDLMGISRDCNGRSSPFEFRGTNTSGLGHCSLHHELHPCAVYLARTDFLVRLEFEGKPASFGMGTVRAQPRGVGKGNRR